MARTLTKAGIKLLTVDTTQISEVTADEIGPFLETPQGM